MVRLSTSLSILTTIIIALVATLVYAAVTVNTPGRLTKGAKTTLTWSTDSTSGTSGNLRIHNDDTGAEETIVDTLDITLKKYDWTVSVDAGTYYLVINDGTGDNYSGKFQVIEANTTSTTSGGDTTTTTINTGRSSTTPTNSGSQSGSGKPPSSSNTEKDKSTTTSKPNANSTPGPTNTGGSNSPAPVAGAAQTIKPNLLNLCLGLGLIASVVIKYF